MEKTNFELKNGFGFLHKSEKKSKKNSPDYFGSINVNNEVYRISAWQQEKGYKNLTLDKENLSVEENEELREEFLKQFKKDVKKSDDYVMCEQTGNLHVQKDNSKDEDYFGQLMIDGNKISIKGFLRVKNEKPYIKLEVSNGKLSEKERKKIKESF